MSADTVWFYELEGERHGPVSAAEILELIGKSALGPSNLLWREGLADWISISASELAPARSTPTTMPPVLSAAPPPVPRILEAFVPRQARLRPGFNPSIRSSYGRAWNLLTTRFWPFVGCFALTSLILGVASQFYVPMFFLMLPLMGGLYWYILRCVRGEDANMEMLFEGFRRQFGPLAIANLILSGIGIVFFGILTAVIIAVAVLVSTNEAAFETRAEDPVFLSLFVGACILASFVLMVPLLILGVVGNFATILILDSELKPGEALHLAWRAIKPHLFKFILFMFVNIALSYAGMFAFCFGMFITGTWATIALVYLYEDAFGDEPGAV